jgi:hypothetical protein
MLRELWDKLMGRERADAERLEAERERMSPAERRFSEESIDDYQADESSIEHLGGFEPESLIEDDEPRRS